MRAYRKPVCASVDLARLAHGMAPSGPACIMLTSRHNKRYTKTYQVACGYMLQG